MNEERDIYGYSYGENTYKILWVNSDYKIKEVLINAESKKKAIIEFFKEVDAIEVENYKIKKEVE
tara:strand:+ start:143 stop:337 length:195 start_codon:yes stop_codon:yes gene_type:complete